jgi:hypothetical protein
MVDVADHGEKNAAVDASRRIVASRRVEPAAGSSQLPGRASCRVDAGAQADAGGHGRPRADPSLVRGRRWFLGRKSTTAI